MMEKKMEPTIMGLAFLWEAPPLLWLFGWKDIIKVGAYKSPFSHQHTSQRGVEGGGEGWGGGVVIWSKILVPMPDSWGIGYVRFWQQELLCRFEASI